MSNRHPLRDARPDDWHEIAVAHRLARQAAYAAFLPAATLEAHLKRAGEDYWRRHLPATLKTEDLFLVAEAGDTIVGLVHLSNSQIERLYVVPDCWGQAVAESLSRATLEHAAERGEERLVLETNIENGRERRFYARLSGREGRTWDETFPDGASTPLVEVTWELAALQLSK